MSAGVPPLLLVEDEADDRMLFELMLAPSGDLALHFAGDGEEALEYLERTGRHAGRAGDPLPALVVLDLKLPRRNGLEVLARIRDQDALRHLPVVILSSSQEVADVARARALGIEEYYVKPVDLTEFGLIVRAIAARWSARVHGG